VATGTQAAAAGGLDSAAQISNKRMQKNAEKTDAKIDQILATQDKAAAAAQRKHAKPVSKRTPGRP